MVVEATLCILCLVAVTLGVTLAVTLGVTVADTLCVTDTVTLGVTRAVTLCVTGPAAGVDVLLLELRVGSDVIVRVGNDVIVGVEVSYTAIKKDTKQKERGFNTD